VRFLRVTGHYRPEALMDAVNRHPFDTILMSLNAADTHIHSFTEQLLPLVVQKQMGIIGMKMPVRGRLLSTWTPPSLEQQQHSSEGSAIATRSPGDLLRRPRRNTVQSQRASAQNGCRVLAIFEIKKSRVKSSTRAEFASSSRMLRTC